MIKVIVRYEGVVHPAHQGEAMLEFEKHLRRITKQDIRVLKDVKKDDSKLRVMMTPAQRAKL